MVYIIVFDVQGTAHGRWETFTAALKELGAERALSGDAWLLESPKSAAELYIALAGKLSLPHPDKLLIAEITTNSIGSYIVAGGESAGLDAGPDVIAALVGRARRD